MSSVIENVAACPGCDLLQSIPVLPPGGKARCPRCGHVIAASKPNSLERTLAITVAAAITLVVANTAPLMGISAVGRHVSTTILGGVLEMWLQGQEITALLVALCAIIAPTAYIGLMLVILLAVRKSPAPAWVGTCMRMAELSQPWGMAEVMMLGILVALIKIGELATLILGAGIFAVGALIVLIAAMTVSFDRHVVWTRIRWADEESQKMTASAELTDMGRSGI
ncbi:MAG: paraquat-inducible protein A [Smithella sp.]